MRGGNDRVERRKAVKRKETAEYRQRLREILNVEDEDKRISELKRLAKDVGAGYEHNEIVAATVTTTGTLQERRTYGNSISESELVLNINNALQTETMIDMCNTASRNFWIALTSVIIALLAMVAAWAAVLVNFVGCGG
jgi:hypothetical protein